MTGDHSDPSLLVGVSGLVQGYGRRKVINGLDLQVGPGVLGLLGPNGAGKSTLLRTLATVTPPRAGSLTVLGRPVLCEADARTVRRDIGYLPQDFGYYPQFTVTDFVRYCAWLRGVPDAQAAPATHAALAAVGLHGQARARMKSLSGGMLRRAGIATAIVGEPRILLLDEPTVGLDPAQRLEFRALLRSLSGASIVLSTHLVEDISAVCEDVAVLQNGRCVFRGTPDELAGLAGPGAAGDTPLERGYMTVLSGMTVPA